ncbi:uncharacterized protein LOC131632615 [Vicia villosa]|uniref:uncharacterized protein LOC131632615 n=1 Tax=Vicia villosa TaxID=3911 RepID=UPI00273B3320|nr:uncharacterized protein LOC131632615 [Vicia villosa]
MKNLVKKVKSEPSELPDCVISHIFSKLSLKNLVKTSALSKQWYHEWGLRKDLTFDLHNMFDTIPELPKSLPLFQQLQSQFATRLNNFIQKYHGDMISSIQINFPLGWDNTRVIDTLIRKGILKGVNRIELLFAPFPYEEVDFENETLLAYEETNFEITFEMLLAYEETYFKIEPYNFLFPPFLSDSNSLTYLHLQNCHIMEFSGLKNLTTLVLHLVPVQQKMLQDMCLKCIHLENLTLNECTFKSDIKITSATLLHLNINCGEIIQKKINIDIIASNLSSIEYSSECISKSLLHTLNIKPLKLSKFSYTCAKISNLVHFSGLKNVTTILLDGLKDGDVITHLFSKCLQLEHITINMCWFTRDFKIIGAKLRHLSILDCFHSNVGIHALHFSSKDRGRTKKRSIISIDALNLSSFEFRGHPEMRSMISIEAPKLLKDLWDAGFNKICI